MKNNIFKLLLASVIIVSSYSCDKVDGAHYAGENNKVSFLVGEVLNLNMDPSKDYVEIPVTRTSSVGELTVDVELTSTENGYTDVFKVEGPINFKNNESKTLLKVNFNNLSTIDPVNLSVSASGLDVNVGLGYPFKVAIKDQTALSPGAVGIANVTASSRLEFEDIGKGTLNSLEGWEGEILEVSIQKAKNANVYKVIQPFGFNSFAFMIKSDGETVICPDQVIYDFGPDDYGPTRMTGVVGKVNADGKIVLNVGAYRVDAGSFGDGVEIITLP